MNVSSSSTTLTTPLPTSKTTTATSTTATGLYSVPVPSSGSLRLKNDEGYRRRKNDTPASFQDQNSILDVDRSVLLPVDLLWLPYIVLTLILTSLLIASFIHFHCKNGHKYRSRRRSASSPSSSSTSSSRDWRQKIVENVIASNSNDSKTAVGGSVTGTFSVTGAGADAYGAVRSWMSDDDVHQQPPSSNYKGQQTKQHTISYCQAPPIEYATATALCGDQHELCEMRSSRDRQSRDRQSCDRQRDVILRGRDNEVGRGRSSSHSVNQCRDSTAGPSSRERVSFPLTSNHRLRSSAVVYPRFLSSNAPQTATASGTTAIANSAGGSSSNSCGGRPAIASCFERRTNVKTVQEYVSNMNGSMVNMKCGRPENVITFCCAANNHAVAEHRQPTRIACDPILSSDAPAGVVSGATGSSSGNRKKMVMEERPRTGNDTVGDAGKDRHGNNKAIYWAAASNICRMGDTDKDWDVLLSAAHQSTL